MKALALLTLVVGLAVAQTAQASSPSLTAYLGCSISTQYVDGFEREGGTGFWHPASAFDGNGTLGSYPGGSLTMWMTDYPYYWPQFDAMLAAQPNPSRIWVQVCAITEQDTLAVAHSVIAKVRQRLPGVDVYVSPLSRWENPVAAFVGDAERSEVITDALVADGTALRGPAMPVLSAQYLLPDGVHVNVDGRRLGGRALLRSFGSISLSGDVKFLPEHHLQSVLAGRQVAV